MHPHFVWALTACLVPIVIHFLQRHSKKRFQFSTMRFFPAGAMRTSKIRSIKKILLLLTRCAILAIIVFLFAVPYNRENLFSKIADPSTELYAYIDPTISMEYIDNGVSLRQKAFAVMDSLNKYCSQFEKKYLFDDMRNEFEPLQSVIGKPHGSSRHGASNVEEMMNVFESKKQGTNAIRYLVVLSDFQKKESMFFDSLFRVRQENPVALVSVAPANPWNYGLRNVCMKTGDDATVEMQVSCFGKSLKQGAVNAFVNGMRVGHSDITMEPDKTNDAKISIKRNQEALTGTVRLENKDPFPLDNIAYFAKGVSRSSRVLIVGDPQRSFPLRAAFNAMGTKQWAVHNKKETEVSYGDIDSVDVVVLADIHAVSQPLTMLLHGKAFGPKAILFSPVIDSAYSFINASVLPVHLKKPPAICLDEKTHPIVFPDTLSTLFKGFGALKDLDAEIRGYLFPLPGEALATLDNGKALVSGLIDSVGNSWVLFGTSLCLQPQGDGYMNNLVETGLYVAILDRMARFAIASLRIENKNLIAGIPFVNPYFGDKGGAKVYDYQNNLIDTWQRQKMVLIRDQGCYKIMPLKQSPYWVCTEIDTAELDFGYRKPSIANSNKAIVRYMNSKEFIDFSTSKKDANSLLWLWVTLGLLLLAEVFLWEKRPF